MSGSFVLYESSNDDDDDDKPHTLIKIYLLKSCVYLSLLFFVCRICVVATCLIGACGKQSKLSYCSSLIHIHIRKLITKFQKEFTMAISCYCHRLRSLQSIEMEPHDNSKHFR